MVFPRLQHFCNPFLHPRFVHPCLVLTCVLSFTRKCHELASCDSSIGFALEYEIGHQHFPACCNRGSKGDTPWNYTLNLSLAYTPLWADKKLTLQADVLNVLNRQEPTFYYSNYATDRVTPDQRYNQPLGYTAPRQVRLSARYDF